MFRKSQTDEQVTIFNHLVYAGPQMSKAVDDSRAKMVGDHFYPAVDEDKFVRFFSDNSGSRPNISIRTYVSALVLKRLYRLSDEDLIEFLRCGAMNFQYALHTSNREEQPLSERSLTRFRQRIREYNKANGCDILKEEFEDVSRKLAVDMGLLPGEGDDEQEGNGAILVRMDSVEVEAHAKVMSRLEILYTTVMIVIRYLVRKKHGDLIPDGLMHYLDKEDHNRVVYWRARREEKEGIQDTRVAETVRELVQVRDIMQGNFTPSFLEGVPEYRVLERVISEQTEAGADGGLVPRDKKAISADSVQNPFDVTVTYRNKRGPHHGSVLNVAEVHDGKGNGILISGSLEPNTASDSAMAQKYLESQPEGGPRQELEVDGAYAGQELKDAAAGKNIDVVATSLTGKNPDDIMADFQLDKGKTEVVSCPAGKHPTSCTYSAKSGIIRAKMPGNCCASCPYRDRCRAKVNNKKQQSTVSVRMASVKRALAVRELGSDKVRLAARRRNGVEGVMSVMRRKYGLDIIPVFGIGNASTWIWTSLLAYNLVKYKKFKLRPAV